MWPGVGHCAPLAGTSRLHRRAAYTRCLRCAGAPRRPASGSGLSLPFRPDMPSSLTPGSSSSHVSSCATPTRPSPRSERLGTPNTPAIGFTRGPSFEAPLFRICYGLSGCSPPWTDLTEFPQPPGAFTSRLPTGWSPVPPLDMTTTATGLLCWRDFHPQEWQLASLHQTRTCRFPASGSSGESLAPGDVAMDDPGFVDHPSNDAVRDSPVEEAPQMAMVSATPGLAPARWAIRCRFVDRFAGLRVPSRVSQQRFSAPGASLPSDGSR